MTDSKKDERAEWRIEKRERGYEPGPYIPPDTWDVYGPGFLVATNSEENAQRVLRALREPVVTEAMVRAARAAEIAEHRRIFDEDEEPYMVEGAIQEAGYDRIMRAALNAALAVGRG